MIKTLINQYRRKTVPDTITFCAPSAKKEMTLTEVSHITVEKYAFDLNSASHYVYLYMYNTG